MSIVLIDGKNAIYRHHFVNRSLTNDEGHPTGAIHGCLNSMISLSQRLPEASFVWVWDGNGETWRHRMMTDSPQVDSTKFPEPVDEDGSEQSLESFGQQLIMNSLSYLSAYDKPIKKSRKPRKRGYKANRVYGASVQSKKDKYPTDDRSRALLQIPVLRSVLSGAGFRQFSVKELEGDDLMAMLAKRIHELDPDEEVIIHSGDKDYYQLLDNPNTRILKGLKQGGLEWVKKRDVIERFGVAPCDWIKYRALTGDSSDNIPHLWKVGPKTALKMLAAGIDPSVVDCRKIPDSAKEQFAKYFQPHGIAKMWGAIYGNYKLCQLVNDIRNPLLSEGVLDTLDIMFAPLTSLRKFRRKASVKTPENWRKLTVLFGTYELNTIMSLRDEFWNIP